MSKSATSKNLRLKEKWLEVRIYTEAAIVNNQQTLQRTNQPPT
jgi:hypothetical protein